MHETGIARSLLGEVERIALLYGGPKVASVRVRMGAHFPFSEAHLRAHFTEAAKGTVAERATLIVERGTDPTEPLAQDVALVSIDVEDILPMTVRAASISAKHRR